MPFTHDTRRIPGSMRPDLTSAPLPTSYTTRGVWVSEATVFRRRSGGAPKMAPRGRGGGAQLPRWGRTELVCASVLFPHQSVPYRAFDSQHNAPPGLASCRSGVRRWKSAYSHSLPVRPVGGEWRKFRRHSGRYVSPIAYSGRPIPSRGPGKDAQLGRRVAGRLLTLGRFVCHFALPNFGSKLLQPPFAFKWRHSTVSAQEARPGKLRSRVSFYNCAIFTMWGNF